MSGKTLVQAQREFASMTRIYAKALATNQPLARKCGEFAKLLLENQSLRAFALDVLSAPPAAVEPQLRALLAASQQVSER